MDVDKIQEISSGIIIFRHLHDKRLYLLLHYQFKGDYWDFPRGNVKKRETTKQAALRETEEETGLSEVNLRFMEGFEETATWHYMLEGRKVFKIVTYFLAETKRTNIRISEEHVGFQWVDFDEALDLLKYKNSKKLLTNAEMFLRKLEEHMK